MVDGAVAEATPLDIAAEQGARLIAYVNPRVPIRNDRSRLCLPLDGGHCARLAEKGVDWIGDQALRMLLAAKLEDTLETLLWLGFLVTRRGSHGLAEDHERFLDGLGFNFHEVVLPERGERFNTNCAPDFFILTHRRTRERALSQLRARALPEMTGTGMSQKMVDALREVAAAGAGTLGGASFHEGERAVLNDACGWSDAPIRVIMEYGALRELEPETTWYLRGGARRRFPGECRAETGARSRSRGRQQRSPCPPRRPARLPQRPALRVGRGREYRRRRARRR